PSRRARSASESAISCRVDVLPIRLSPVGAGRVTAAAGSCHDSATNGIFCFASTTRDSQILAVAAAGHITLIWQDCCFEAVLLRHLAGHEQDNPPTATVALTRLNAAWPGYSKGLSAHDLQKTLTLDMVKQVAQNPRNADSLRFLQEMDLLQH
ncbi:MAG: hypothetical protein OXD33_00525, partial [Rhodobacteraceae bacterium]|nr:hypothetical protein [Paracoccaceae bacterium]